jgi:hypothetical protein
VNCPVLEFLSINQTLNNATLDNDLALARRRIMSKLPKLLVVILAIVVGFLSAIQAQEANKDILGAMRYRYIGPVGNRVTSVVSVPGQPNLYYVGAASGGIFKTTDGGIHWEPIFDGQPVSSIGSLAIAPSDANIVWAVSR